MKGQWLRRLLALAGYLLYTLAVLLFLLVYLFPAKDVMGRLQYVLNQRVPGVTVRVLGLGLDYRKGVGLQAVDLTERRSGRLLLHLSELYVRPAWKEMGKGKIACRWQFQAAGGTIRGRAEYGGQKSVLITGQGGKIDLSRLAFLRDHLHRSFTGALMTEFTCRQPLAVTGPACQGKVLVQEGSAGLQQPVFGLDRLRFTTCKADLRLTGKKVILSNGYLQGPELTSNFSGVIEVRVPIGDSPLQLSGTIQPRSELFARLRDSGMAATVREMSRQGIPLQLYGVLGQPSLRLGLGKNRMGTESPR